MELSQCLFCSEHCDPLEEEERTPFSLLGRQLKAVFVLRELLRLPPEKLTRFLERSGGDHPHQWIPFCDPCQILVDKAFSHFEQMVQIHKRFKKAQEKVVRKVKESGRGRGHGSRDAVAEETREFVKNHDYGTFESRFLAGDWEAEWQLELRRAAAITPEVAVKEEVDYEDDEPQGDMEEFSGSGAEDTESLDGIPTEAHVKGAGEQKPVEAKTKECAPPPAKPFPCPLCPLSYATKGGRWEHVQRRHKGQTHMLKYVENEQPTPCPVCGKMCKGRKGVNLHQKLHTDLPRKPKEQKGGACPTCHKIFTINKTLKLHVKRQNCQPEFQEDGSVVAKLARKGRSPKGTVLDSEMFTENGQTVYRCAVTGCASQVFSSRRSFLSHKNYHNKRNPPTPPPEDKWFTCGFCQDKFLGLRGLQIHQRLQHPEQQPPAPQPKVQIPRAPVDPALEGQKRWRRFARQCPHCRYTGTRDMMEAHVKRKHEGGQYPLHCELCAKGVATPNVLKLHQAAKHFICGVTGCALHLESKEQLHAHQVGVHGREVNLFKCEECGKLSVTRQKRERHKEQVHRRQNAEGAEQHICDLCGKTFAFREYLQNHVWHAHKKLRKPKPKKEESVTQ